MHSDFSSVDLAGFSASEANRKAADLKSRLEWLEGIVRACGMQADDEAVKRAIADIAAEREAENTAQWERDAPKREANRVWVEKLYRSSSRNIFPRV